MFLFKVTSNSDNTSTVMESYTPSFESLRYDSESDNETVVMPSEINRSTTNGKHNILLTCFKRNFKLLLSIQQRPSKVKLFC